MQPILLSRRQVDEAVANLRGWGRVVDQLVARYVFPTFSDAVSFTGKVAEIAEALDHHPEWRVAYRDVELMTTTHDAGGLTQRDLELATRIDALAAASSAIAR